MALSDRVAVLQGGRIQQCGAPMEVYQNPANLFVAGFIGSPPINVLDAALFDDLVTTDIGVNARDVVVGVRPADITVWAEPRDHALAGEVLLCEPTGNDLWVVGRCGNQRIVGRGPAAAPLAAGGKAYFEYSPERLYLFERASGGRVR